MTSTNTDQTIFIKFEQYDFDKDENFQAGLPSILESNQNKSQEELDKLKEKAKWFYFSKVVQKFDYNEYLAWKLNKSSTLESSNNINLTKQDTTTNVEAPKYSRSFQELVEMIRSNKPIPGIKEIPDEINSGIPSSATIKPRPKPWEKKNISETI
ncbi:5851_t:CDS:2 [Scutellospora calospora]|uniref:5851_t:CDS:1 n=1 Tax=Scutellospora calospora TaxID=85575 RepID=A0ACA9KPJ0_9GLOM|nr:5851_t:CDS:2 [Scutellospora calospora]